MGAGPHTSAHDAQPDCAGPGAAFPEQVRLSTGLPLEHQTSQPACGGTSELFWCGQCVTRSLFFWVELGVFLLGGKQRSLCSFSNRQGPGRAGLLRVERLPGVHTGSGTGRALGDIYSFLIGKLGHCHVPGTVRCLCARAALESAQRSWYQKTGCPPQRSVRCLACQAKD